jgi:hypothetical protein
MVIYLGDGERVNALWLECPFFLNAVWLTDECKRISVVPSHEVPVILVQKGFDV